MADNSDKQKEADKKKNDVTMQAFEELTELALDLPVEKYGGVWHIEELAAMRRILTGGRGKFPKKVWPYIGLFRKYLFLTSQLVAMAAAAHHHAQDKNNQEEPLIKPATFADVAKLEKEKAR